MGCALKSKYYHVKHRIKNFFALEKFSVFGNFICGVQGGDLSDKISEQKNSLQAFPEEQITQWMIQILLALQYMHDRQVQVLYFIVDMSEYWQNSYT